MILNKFSAALWLIGRFALNNYVYQRGGVNIGDVENITQSQIIHF